jgi:hypothetical protein
MGVTLLPFAQYEDYSALDFWNRPTEIEVTMGEDGVTVVDPPNNVTSSIDRKKCMTLHTDNDPYPNSVTLVIYIVLSKVVRNVVSSEICNVEPL